MPQSRQCADQGLGDSQWNPTSFNGFQLTDLTDSPITNVSIDPSSNLAGLTDSDVTFGPNFVQVNWQGLYFTDGTQVILDLNGASPVPEPAVVASLLGMGLLSLGGVLLRSAARRHNAIAANKDPEDAAGPSVFVRMALRVGTRSMASQRGA